MAPALIVALHPETFPTEFSEWLDDNLHVWDAFAAQALSVVNVGFKHYSARTIIEVLRHHSALTEGGGIWKLNDHTTAYLARLFALAYPQHAKLFEFRPTNLEKEREAA
jgi:hypothetical protein